MNLDDRDLSDPYEAFAAGQRVERKRYTRIIRTLIAEVRRLRTRALNDDEIATVKDVIPQAEITASSDALYKRFSRLIKR